MTASSMHDARGIERLESDLWEAADNLRANSKLTSNDYFMPVLGVIFLRHAANRFEAARTQIEEDQASGKMPKRPIQPADYISRRALWLPEEARYDWIMDRAAVGGTDLPRLVTDAMTAIEASFEPLQGVLRISRELERMSLRFFDPDAPVTKAATATVEELFADLDISDAERAQAVDVVLRFLRTPSFLVRHTNLAETNRVRALERALEKTDSSGRSLRAKLEGFGQFLADRIDEERAELLAALAEINTGSISALADESLLPGEDADRREALLPNVRLANGGTSREARRRLMLTFNTPFFPEALISSAVMGEGVDLQHECRHAIHHDLDWNPSVLEQRTGRLDRLGSKAETTGFPIVVYEPFLEGTQDEKQFRVVKDRERWFNVVMGEKLELDERSTERLAERVPLPAEAAEEISMRLEVTRR